MINIRKIHRRAVKFDIIKIASIRFQVVEIYQYKSKEELAAIVMILLKDLNFS